MRGCGRGQRRGRSATISRSSPQRGGGRARWASGQTATPRVVVRLPKQDAPTPSPVEIAQLVAWLEARRAGSAWAPRAVRILAATGCRIGEIEALTWRDIDLDRRVLRVRSGKTGARLVPLTEGVCARISSWGPGHPDSPLFGVAFGTVRHNLDRALRAACVALGFPAYSAHSLRRAACDALYRSGADVAAAAAVLGHSPAVALAHYRRATEADARRAVEGAALGDLPLLLAYGEGGMPVALSDDGAGG